MEMRERDLKEDRKKKEKATKKRKKERESREVAEGFVWTGISEWWVVSETANGKDPAVVCNKIVQF